MSPFVYSLKRPTNYCCKMCTILCMIFKNRLFMKALCRPLFTKYANCKPLFSFEKWIGIPRNIPKIKSIKKSSLNERNISALSINLKQNWTKSTWKPKKVCHGRNYLIYYRQELHPNQILYDYIVCNIKPCQTQLTLTVLYYN